MGYRLFLGNYRAPVAPSGGAAIPAGGMRGRSRKAEYGFVQYPEKGLIFECKLTLSQEAPAFSAAVECYRAPEVVGRINPTHSIKAKIQQARAVFEAAVHQELAARMEVVQQPQEFRATLFLSARQQKMPKWIEDVVNKNRDEQDDEEAILAILFGRKL